MSSDPRTPENVAGDHELDSPFIDAPVWPWAVAGWSFAALFAVLFVVARIYA